MAEQFKTISEARNQLPRIAQAVQGGGERCVITNQGKPQAVLLGYEDFQGLIAAAELLSRPRELAHLNQGLAQERRLTLAELKQNLQRRKTDQSSEQIPASFNRLIEELREKSILVESEEEEPIRAKLEQIDRKLTWMMGQQAFASLPKHKSRLSLGIAATAKKAEI